MAELTLTNENLKKEVLEKKGLVLVDFWAAWCGPCKMLAPVIAEIAQECADEIRVGKVNVDEEMELARAYRVMSIPTLLLFKDGELVKTSVGFAGKEEITAMWK